ncbi:hypothetical protein [uncultured Ramlibacter sp.]|uniref:hypothetical protein n=1 Tax=uncultured Ramlibacter sp. TaxID=260755 RepID=UPI00261FD3B2|nr:hypothetical protein [uncultured Ramlibacter sp.]
MPDSLITRLETDAKIIRVLLLVRASLWTTHGGHCKLAGDAVVTLDNRLEVGAIDSALKALGIDGQEPLPQLP